MVGKDYTLFALQDGIVQFETDLNVNVQVLKKF